MSTTREKNDTVRQGGAFGPDTEHPLYVTPGVQALGEDAIASLYLDCMPFSDSAFEDAPDHDFGVLEVSGITVWFKIEPHPEGTERRVFTFLLPEEH
jgi:hypothetical protein